MKFFEFFVIALRSILSNKLRSSLTMLGVIIGVGSVITLVAVVGGLQNMITSTFEELGTDVLYVQPRNPDAPGAAGISPQYAPPTLTLDDSEAIADLPLVVGTAPTNENFIEVKLGDESTGAVIHGSTSTYLEAFNYTVASGQFISDRDVAARDTVIVLGYNAYKELFGSGEAVGQEVKLKDRRFRVIGVLAPKGGSFFGFSLDDVVVVPITTYQSRLFAGRSVRGEQEVQSIAIKVTGTDVIPWVTEDIENLLRKRHKIDADEEDDFAVVTSEQILGIFETITMGLTLVLGFIASISLLVGSIGIMNIMLVSVTERTREIGLRKAVGAKRRDILSQFLLEAAMLSLVGGGIGVVGGWAISEAISFMTTVVDLGGVVLKAEVSLFVVIGAFLFSFMIGIFSGIYPAMRAARLNPIDALHYG